MPSRQQIVTATADGQPVLIAGPTGSGKSALALDIAANHGGTVINADALQVFANWRILTARPDPDDMTRARHALYGHVPGDAPYSTGQWLRDVAPLLTGTGADRPIITGGTGLYFAALTEGLAAIPPIPGDVRAAADALTLDRLIAMLDDQTAHRIDLANRARVQRAWEVLIATGHSLSHWQAQTPPPLLAQSDAHAILLTADRDWLAHRIEARFDRMLASGALDEARANLATFHPAAPSSRAIGAADLIAHLKGTIDLDTARANAIVATRRYAKRQRTWFRARMADWTALPLPDA